MTPTADNASLGAMQRLFKFSMARALAAFALVLAGFIGIVNCFHPVPGAAVIIPAFTGLAAAVMSAADWSDTKKPGVSTATLVGATTHDPV